MAFYIDYDYSAGKWFKYPDQPDLEFKLRFLSPMKFISLKTEHENENKNVEEKSLSNAVLQYVIMEWRGFFTGEGADSKPAELTLENLEKVHAIDPRIIHWIVQIASERSNFQPEEKTGKLLKNSKSSSDS